MQAEQKHYVLPFSSHRRSSSMCSHLLSRFPISPLLIHVPSPACIFKSCVELVCRHLVQSSAFFCIQAEQSSACLLFLTQGCGHLYHFVPSAFSWLPKMPERKRAKPPRFVSSSSSPDDDPQRVVLEPTAELQRIWNEIQLKTQRQMLEEHLTSTSRSLRPPSAAPSVLSANNDVYTTAGLSPGSTTGNQLPQPSDGAEPETSQERRPRGKRIKRLDLDSRVEAAFKRRMKLCRQDHVLKKTLVRMLLRNTTLSVNRH